MGKGAGMASVGEGWEAAQLMCMGHPWQWSPPSGRAGAEAPLAGLYIRSAGGAVLGHGMGWTWVF